MSEGPKRNFSLCRRRKWKENTGSVWSCMWPWLLCNFMFLPHTQCYSTIVAQSITCRKIQIYILCLELILNNPLRLFILSKTYQGHLLITEHTSCSKSNLFFLFVFVQKLKQIHCVSKGSTSNVSGRNWANQQLPRKVIWQCYCFQVGEKQLEWIN